MGKGIQMENLAGFYNNLFAIEIAVFGIVVATVFVFIQLVYSTFSYGSIKFILRDGLLPLYGLFNVLGLLLTAAGSASLALEGHNLIPSLDLGTRTLVTSQCWVWLAISTVFLSLLFIIVFVLKNLRYLSPKRVLLLYAEGLKYKQIRDFLFKKFGVADPNQYKFVLTQWRQIFEPERGRTTPTEDNVARAAEEHQRRVRRKERIEKRVKNKTDPLTPVTGLIINLIKRADLKSLEEAVDMVCQLSKEVIGGVPREIGEWYPEQNIPKNYTDYLVEHLKTQLEICSNENLSSAELLLLNSSNCLAETLLENKYFRELEGLAEFWKRIADKSMGKSPQTFIQIIGYYRQTLDALFELLRNQREETKSIEESINAVFGDLGWLSEQLILNLPLEERPWFPDYDYSDEFDSLWNLLLNYGHEYEKQSKLYPLIYFDALLATLQRLAKVLFENPEKRGLKEMIYSILFTYSSFAKSALESDNLSGAELSATNLARSYDTLRGFGGLEELRDQSTKELIEIGSHYLKNKARLTERGFLNESLDAWIIKQLIENRHELTAISKKVEEDYPTLEFDYIKELGKAFRTNFGFMFDWRTGETYPEGDPRRGR